VTVRKCFFRTSVLFFSFITALVAKPVSDFPLPSVYVEGKVNAITGEFYDVQEDLVVQGVEPIHIKRAYLNSTRKDWIFLPHTLAIMDFSEERNDCTITESNGCKVHYQKVSETIKRGKTISRYEPLDLYLNNLKSWEFDKEAPQNFCPERAGLADRQGASEDKNYGAKPTQSKTNSSSCLGIASGMNLKNNYALYNENTCQLTLYTAEGIERVYEKRRHSHDISQGKSWLLFSEHLPNGNWILYDYTKIKDKLLGPIFSLVSIRSMNPSKTTQYAQVTFTHYPETEDPRLSSYYEKKQALKSESSTKKDVETKEKDKRLFIEGSDGQRLEYQYDRQSGYLTAVISDACRSDQFYEHSDERMISACVSPLNRRLNIDYYFEPKEAGKVKKLSAPVGPGGTMLPIHTFIYENKKTTVYDAEKNWDEYHYDDQFRIQRLERYSNDGKLHNIEQFVWGKQGSSDVCHLIGKTFLDQNRSPVWGKRFFYDQRSNLIQEKTYGNFSGRGTLLTLDSRGLPQENGVETVTKEWIYSDECPSLLLESKTQDGIRNTYEYLPKTNLPISQLTYVGGEISQRKFWEYNTDNFLIREIADDGKSANSKDKTGVTVQTIRDFLLLEEGPYLGMPGTIEEKYWDGSGERLLQKTVLHYGKAGLVEQKDIYDAGGVFRYNESTKYDSKGRVKSETNALGWTAISETDELGNKVYYKDFGGRTETIYSYDCGNRMVEKKIKGFDGLEETFHYTYTTQGALLSEIDSKSHTTSYTLTPFGECAIIHLPPIPNENGSIVSPVISAEFDVFGNKILQMDVEGHATKISYNAYGSPVEVIHPDLSKETYEYFLDGTLKRYTDQEEVETTYERDAFRQPIRKTITQKGEVLTEETFQYKGQQLIAKVDAEGNRTTFAYDGAGRKISEVFDGEKVTLKYDELDRQHIREKGNVRTLLQFDLLNRVEELREENAQTGQPLRKTVYQHDSGHNITTISRWINEELTQTCEQFDFDSQNRLRSRKDPAGQVETITYDNSFLDEHNQQVLQKTITDPMGLKTIETFDTQGRVAKIEKRKGDRVLSIEEKRYNTHNLLAIQINTVFSPKSSTRTVRTKWEYDSLGRLKTLKEGEGLAKPKISTYTYTPRGRKKTVTKPDGCTLTYEYNGLGNLERLVSSDGTVHHQIRYNRLGALIWNDGIERKVDGQGRILSETFPNRLLIENTYGEDGERELCRIPAADCLIEYHTNGLDLIKVSRRTLRGEGVYEHTYLNRDLSGNLLSVNLPENLGTIHFNYDPYGRKESIDGSYFSQKVLETDALGNLLRVRTQNSASSFTYDDLYQLTSERGVFNHDYQYDSLHCRLKKDNEIYQFSPLNQPVSHVEYNKNGTPTRQGNIFYSFDALDRLTRIATPERSQTFVYDCLNRRLSSTTLQNGIQKTIHYLYDGQNEIGAFDETPAPIEFCVLGEGSSIAIEMQGKAYATVHDLSGNIAALLPLDHSEATVYRYGSFGEEQVAGPTKSPWRFSSMRVDEIGIVYYGPRFYQPELGRWLTPDPAGFVGGMNVYAFRRNNPLAKFDD